MRLRFTITSALIFLSCQLSAQVKFDRNHIIGLWAGATGSNVSFNPTVDQRYSIGRVFGVGYNYYSDYFLRARWGVGIECNYVEKGWVEDLVSPEEYERKFSYLEVPLFTRISFENKGWALTFSMGPFMSFKLEESETNTIESGEQYYFHGQETDKSFEFGLGGGMAIVKKIGASRIALDFRYMYSMSDIFDYDEEQLLAASHQYAAVGLSFYFALKSNLPNE